jgi:putative flippase GtrA
MKAKIQTLLKKPGYRYLLVGGAVYVLEVAVIVVAQRLGASPVLAVGLSFWIGLVFSFVLQKLVTFGDKRLHHRVLSMQIIAVALLVIFNFGFTLLVTKLLYRELPAVVTRTLALGITTIWNFYLYKTRIFKSSAEPVY